MKMTKRKANKKRREAEKEAEKFVIKTRKFIIKNFVVATIVIMNTMVIYKSFWKSIHPHPLFLCSLFHAESSFVRSSYSTKKHIYYYMVKRSFKPKVTIQKQNFPWTFLVLLDISNIQFQTKSFSAFDLISGGLNESLQFERVRERERELLNCTKCNQKPSRKMEK